ncbi:DUF4124 domain-containing protein [Pseudoalteromonas sp. GB56]
MKVISPALFLLTLLALPAHSAVYKCTINGVVTFSQLPCGDDAQIINIRSYKSSAADEDDGEKKQPETKPNEIDGYLASQDIDRKINEHQRNIQKFEQEQVEQLALINNINQATANYLGANSIDEAKKQQAAIINANYSARLKYERESIKKLEKEKAKLNEAAESNQPL